VPNFAYQVRLEMWVILSQLADLKAQFSLPPAYRKAITLTLAEDLCPSLGQVPNPQLSKMAAAARKAVQSNNDGSPRTTTTDSGLPSKNKRGGGFNWLSGVPW